MTAEDHPPLGSLPKNFEPHEIERYWYNEWVKRGYFNAGQHVQKESSGTFAVQFPPPNVTGTLHMGHAFNQTIMDGLVRYHRMLGADTVFIPGTDHAGIATQIVVERQLDAQKITRHDLGREAFTKKVWEWKELSGGTITNQVRRLGASADWSREYFTMDEQLSTGVVETFVRLYEEGLIYRGKRLVNWDPVLLTAVSDLEVNSVETQGSLWYVMYPFVDGPQTIEVDGQSQSIPGLSIATTRPETMMADGALCVHPDDERYKHLVGKFVDLPLCDRQIPIIADDFVDPAFGTGVVKITGAHDFNDYACAMRHKLPLIIIFTPDAHVNENAPLQFRGLDRFEARDAVVKALAENKFLVKTLPHTMMQPRGDRTNVVLEPMLTDQWFVAMTKPAPAGSLHPGQSITEVALDVVRKGEVQFFPSNWTTTYNQWLENIQDWCISRQLWWGHQIPAWYGENGQVFVAHTAEQAQEKAQAIGYHGTLTRDPDVLDTWFSSALVPFTTFGWPEQTADLKKYLPSSVLVTGFDIIFFWVARMVMMTTHLTGEVPFKHVYVHGLIRDAEGQKMSKSKGNTLDPVDLIDGIDLESLVTKRLFGLMNPKQAAQIEKDTRKHFPDGIPSFGTDALRFTMAAYASLGRNINFDLKRCEGYRNFCSKLWNASRFVLMHTEQVNIEQPQDAQTQKLFRSITPLTQAKLSALTQPLGLPERWVLSRLQHVKAEVEKGFAEYRFDNIAHSLYHFIWDEYCDWYLELAKVQIQSGDSFTQATCRATLMTVLEEILRLMHPITPFITEALWQKISVIAGTRLIDSVSSVSVQPYPAADVAFIDSQAEDQFAELKAQIEAVRALRSEMSIPPGERLPLIAQGNAKSLAQHTPYLSAMARLSSVEITDTIPTDTDAPVQVVGQTRLMLKVEIDLAAERIRLDKEITRLMQEIEKVNGQLSNEAFVSRAPEAVVTQAKARRSQFAETLEKVSAQRLRLGD